MPINWAGTTEIGLGGTERTYNGFCVVLDARRPSVKVTVGIRTSESAGEGYALNKRRRKPEICNRVEEDEIVSYAVPTAHDPLASIGVPGKSHSWLGIHIAVIRRTAKNKATERPGCGTSDRGGFTWIEIGQDVIDFAHTAGNLDSETKIERQIRADFVVVLSECEDVANTISADTRTKVLRIGQQTSGRKIIPTGIAIRSAYV